LPFFPWLGASLEALASFTLRAGTVVADRAANVRLALIVPLAALSLQPGQWRAIAQKLVAALKARSG
jgi:hypothetical protein